ncbi:MAG: hypothetical protein O4861_24600 [Trichodesmium sp. St16_bin4-tuft]|nr:hypothetical protein [Trichodesmium sp. MAG_R01]MDE5072565.1 hypothetical protein [Trichodesmium sp. St5_bin8]MDE5079712.1 hypothetical protein [Trichodesmium sp. St2_bin6]MDE5101336.1 hypothetical protein [Trichodesmium sp. St16_bin4-tuft]MDE5103981.1 hypothetical protein [Trichodesmium sp. St19_bin2]
MSNEEKRKFLDKKVGEKMVIKIARPGLIIETKTVNITHSLIDLYLEEKIDYVFVGIFDDRILTWNDVLGWYDVHQSYQLRGYAYCYIANEEKARIDWRIAAKLFSDSNASPNADILNNLIEKLDKNQKEQSCIEKLEGIFLN